MKPNELSNLSKEELEEKLSNFKKDLFDLNFQRRYGKVEKSHLFRQVKKNIARILTVLKERSHEK